MEIYVLASVTVDKLHEELRYLFRKKLNPPPPKKKESFFPGINSLDYNSRIHTSRTCAGSMIQFLKLRRFGYVEIGVELCDECEGRLAKHFTTFLLILSISILTHTSMHSLQEQNYFPSSSSFSQYS